MASRLNFKIKGRTAQKSASSSQGKSLVFVCTGAPRLECSKGRRMQNSSCRSLSSNYTLLSSCENRQTKWEPGVDAGEKPTVQPVSQHFAFQECWEKHQHVKLQELQDKQGLPFPNGRFAFTTVTVTGFSASFSKTRKTAKPLDSMCKLAAVGSYRSHRTLVLKLFSSAQLPSTRESTHRRGHSLRRSGRSWKGKVDPSCASLPGLRLVNRVSEIWYRINWIKPCLNGPPATLGTKTAQEACTWNIVKSIVIDRATILDTSVPKASLPVKQIGW